MAYVSRQYCEKNRKKLSGSPELHLAEFIYYLLTESEVITGKSQTEALMY